jgi:hypothetical protein
MNRTGAQSDCCGIESVVRRDSITATAAVPLDRMRNWSFADHQLLRHFAGSLSPYSCTQDQVRAFDEPGPSAKTIILETGRFDNLYNLTGSALAPCSWT